MTIETERLRLRDWTAADHDVIAAIYSDAGHARYIGGPMDRDRAWRMLATLIGHKTLRGYTLFAVEEKSSGQCIGWAGPWYPHGWPEQEIGYSLLPSATGMGYAKEAAAAGLGYAYRTLGWTTAISLIDARNEASKGVARAMGAIRDGSAKLFGTDDAEIWRHLPPAAFAKRMETMV